MALNTQELPLLDTSQAPLEHPYSPSPLGVGDGKCILGYLSVQWVFMDGASSRPASFLSQGQDCTAQGKLQALLSTKLLKSLPSWKAAPYSMA